jgi:hypothetical protein
MMRGALSVSMVMTFSSVAPDAEEFDPRPPEGEKPEAIEDA